PSDNPVHLPPPPARVTTVVATIINIEHDKRTATRVLSTPCTALNRAETEDSENISAAMFRKPSIISQITHSIIGGRTISAIAIIPNPPRVDFKRLRHPLTVFSASPSALPTTGTNAPSENLTVRVVRSSAAALISP